MHSTARHAVKAEDRLYYVIWVRIAQFCDEPTLLHLAGTSRILRYEICDSNIVWEHRVASSPADCNNSNNSSVAAIDRVVQVLLQRGIENGTIPLSAFTNDTFRRAITAEFLLSEQWKNILEKHSVIFDKPLFHPRVGLDFRFKMFSSRFLHIAVSTGPVALTHLTAKERVNNRAAQQTPSVVPRPATNTNNTTTNSGKSVRDPEHLKNKTVRCIIATANSRIRQVNRWRDFTYFAVEHIGLVAVTGALWGCCYWLASQAVKHCHPPLFEPISSREVLQEIAAYDASNRAKNEQTSSFSQFVATSDILPWFIRWPLRLFVFPVLRMFGVLGQTTTFDIADYLGIPFYAPLEEQPRRLAESELRPWYSLSLLHPGFFFCYGAAVLEHASMVPSHAAAESRTRYDNYLASVDRNGADFPARMFDSKLLVGLLLSAELMVSGYLRGGVGSVNQIGKGGGGTIGSDDHETADDAQSRIALQLAAYAIEAPCRILTSMFLTRASAMIIALPLVIGSSFGQRVVYACRGIMPFRYCSLLDVAACLRSPHEQWISSSSSPSCAPPGFTKPMLRTFQVTLGVRSISEVLRNRFLHSGRLSWAQLLRFMLNVFVSSFFAEVTDTIEIKYGLFSKQHCASLAAAAAWEVGLGGLRHLLGAIASDSPALNSWLTVKLHLFSR